MRSVHGNSFGDPSVTGNLPGWESILANGWLENPIPQQMAARMGVGIGGGKTMLMEPPSQGFEF